MSETEFPSEGRRGDRDDSFDYTQELELSAKSLQEEVELGPTLLQVQGYVQRQKGSCKACTERGPA